MSNSDWVSRGIRNKEHHFQRAQSWVNEANETERGLSNTLITLGILILGITSPLITDLQNLSEGQKVIVFFSWIFTIFSIISGCIQFFINMNFFAELAKIENKLERVWSEITYDEESYKKTHKKSKNISEKINLQSPILAFYFQMISLVFSIILIIGVGISVFFFSENKQHYQTNEIRYKKVIFEKYYQDKTHEF